MFERRHGFDQMHERAAEPVEFPNDQHVSLAHIVERLAQARSIGTSAGSALLKDLRATGSGESVELQRQIRREVSAPLSWIPSAGPLVPGLLVESATAPSS